MGYDVARHKRQAQARRAAKAMDLAIANGAEYHNRQLVQDLVVFPSRAAGLAVGFVVAADGMQETGKVADGLRDLFFAGAQGLGPELVDGVVHALGGGMTGIAAGAAGVATWAVVKAILKCTPGLQPPANMI